ncbi:aminotransferase [Rhodobacteraceae bacterium CCMM004]|nr:aminotransferase [Rhodobacteraceae bacterium CCMM004]
MGEAPQRRFTGSFTRQEGLPEAAVAAAEAVLRSGRLHRYNAAPGTPGETAALEAEFAAATGRRYCLAVASGGQALQIALRAAGVAAGAPVLTNAWTLAPVPGAIAGVGAMPVLVDSDDDLRIDMDDLTAKARASGARHLLLSHMRGHICDMDRLTALAADMDLTVIEDCAHTMGAAWGAVPSGGHGRAACYSTQTYKHINSGEGGLLTSDDADLMARATILSGSYMLYARHGAGPPEEAFADIRLDTPNLSARMDELRAAVLRPQLAALADNVARWNARHDAVAAELEAVQGLVLPRRPANERKAASSIQFRLPGRDAAGCRAMLAASAARGVELKWFGAAEPHGYTSAHRSWRYAPAQELPRTDALLATLFDMRLPLTFSLEDCRLIGALIGEAAAETAP